MLKRLSKKLDAKRDRAAGKKAIAEGHTVHTAIDHLTDALLVAKSPRPKQDAATKYHRSPPPNTAANTQKNKTSQ